MSFRHTERILAPAVSITESSYLDGYWLEGHRIPFRAFAAAAGGNETGHENGGSASCTNSDPSYTECSVALIAYNVVADGDSATYDCNSSSLPMELAICMTRTTLAPTLVRRINDMVMITRLWFRLQRLINHYLRYRPNLSMAKKKGIRSPKTGKQSHH